MNVLVVGSGGREHALCWAIAASPLCDRLYCAPGNAGIAADATCVAIAADNSDGLIAFARDNRVDFVVVGPEAPLVAGLVDRLEAAGIKAFGPNAAAAVLEGSKGFVKDLCARHGIPTAAYRRFTDAVSAKTYVAEREAPIVVKADGLAAGKGVVVAETVAQANAAIDAMLTGGRYGDAGSTLVIEEYLTGTEASFFALVDGTDVLPLASAQDHKRAYDGDRGPNTGGMGAFSPSPLVDAAMEKRILAEIVSPTVAAMAAAGTPFRGVLFAGLMLTGDGPKLIEYNVRFGDPECQVLVRRLKSDLLPALLAARDGELAGFDLRWHDMAAVCIVMAARGYPDAYDTGGEIEGLTDAASLEGVEIFHAATRADGGRTVAAGGRVLGVTATGPSIAAARDTAYRAVDLIRWNNGFCRRDIGRSA
ncbi:MAG: phosphoribosylamine--glycine ligase [Inquilinaceae bacterium]